MSRILQPFAALANLTALENLRQPITLLLMTAGVAGMARISTSNVLKGGFRDAEVCD